MNTTLILEELYSKEEIETAFDTNFGPRIKGITQRRSSDNEPYILIFASARGSIVYGDRVEGRIFYYKGEGSDGDQKLTTANKALINSNLNKTPIFGFRQHEIGGKYQYLGLVSVLEWTYADFNGRKVYEFKFEQEGLENPLQSTKEWNEIKNQSELPDPSLTGTGEVAVSTVSSIKRNAAFPLKIKEQYQNRCAVCRKSRCTAAGYPEVQSAHIYPKEKNGADDLRNGIALCRLHHWAFDEGLLAISDDLTLLVNNAITKDEDYEEISKYAGVAILPPLDKRYTPLPLFLTEHRKLHGFE